MSPAYRSIPMALSLPHGKLEILWRHGVHQPDIVLSAVEDGAIADHRRRVHRADHRPAMAPAHDRRRLDVRREMDMMPAHLLKAFAQDHLHCPRTGAVVEHGGRGGELQLQVNVNAVALAGPDALAGRVV